MACCRVGSVAVRAPDLLKEVTIIFTSEVKSLNPVRLFVTPWDSPGKSTGVGCHFLLQGIFPTQGSNPGLLHSRRILYQLSYQGSIITIHHIEFGASLVAQLVRNLPAM